MPEYQYDLTPASVAGKKVTFVKGPGQVQLQNPKLPTEFNEVAMKLFPVLKLLGLMNDGRGSQYNDQEFRLGTPQVSENEVVVPMGLTYRGARAADINRSEAANMELQHLGVSELHDRWGYFSRAIGVAITPITADGVVPLNVRNAKLYNGWVNGVAKATEYTGEEPSVKLFESQALAELYRENGKVTLEGTPRFVGIASSAVRGDADAVWVVHIKEDSSFFKSGEYLKTRTDPDVPPELLYVKGVGERDELLLEQKLQGREFPGIMYSTRLGLEFLTETDLQDRR